MQFLNTHNRKGAGLLLLSAAAITLFMAIPRLIIVVYLKARLYPGADSISWWDFAHKTVYGFLIATIFLWLNASRQKLITPVGKLDLSRFSTRLLLNMLLLLFIRFVSLKWQLYGSGAALSQQVTSFLFSIHLVLEVSFCILAAEIYRLVTRNQQAQLKYEALERLNAENTFEVLKSKVNPHFLFNSLNTIDAMIDKDPAAAKAFVGNMSQVYRYVLNSGSRTVVTLAEELEFAMAYCKMLQERHGESLLLTANISKEYQHTLLPPASIQILLENAIKHNIVSVRNPLTVNIQTRNGRLLVTNPIQEKSKKDPSTGTGLHNLHQRYLHLCQQGIEIERSMGQFQVSLPLIQPGANGNYSSISPENYGS